MTLRRAIRDRESGFGMVEALVAVSLAALFFVAFGQTLAVAIQGARDNRLQQEATAIAAAHIEYGRSLEWKDLALPWIWDTAPMVDESLDLVAAEAGLAEGEPLLFSIWGDLTNRVYESEGDTTFVVWRYVTDPGNGMRRLVILVRWETDRSTHSYQTSTLISRESTL